MPKKSRAWTLLSSHGLVLVTVSRQSDIGIVSLCETLGLSRGTVLRALRDLQRVGMLKVRRRRGRRNTYSVNPEAAFRHPSLSDSHIGDFVKIFHGSTNSSQQEISDTPRDFS